MNYVNLYTETNFSMNGSNIRIRDLIKKAISYEYSSLAITDSKMHGVIKFYKECIKNDIKPIIGLSVISEGVKPESRNHLLLYAKNNNGYQNLIKISSFYSLNNIITLNQLKELSKDIIICINTDFSEVSTYFNNSQTNELNEMSSFFNEISNDIYYSISSNDDLNKEIGKHNKLVVLDFVQYLDKEDIVVSDVLKKIFSKHTFDLFTNNKEKHFKTKNEILTIYKGYPEAIENTFVISEGCDVTISFDEIFLPKFNLKQDVSTKDYLRALAFKGLDKRLIGQKVDKQIYIYRLNYELKIINDMGYDDYFLIVWDFVKYAKGKKYLVGPGRGSAAASLVSYCLGITSIDSIKYDLVFERFLNPDRITMPDIDMDFPDDKRDDIIQYVRDSYGIDKVASICTFGTFLSKSALRDTAKVLEVEGLLLEQIVKLSDNYSNIIDMINNSKEIQNIMEKDENAKNMLEIASKIEGLNRHISTHAAGIIITRNDLVDHTPVQSGLLNMMQTQFEAKDLEDIGLLKIDFLGIRNLTSIDKIVKLINLNEKKKIDIYKVPTNDKITFDLLKRVETTGIFQLESSGMRSLTRKMQIDCFEDIVTILALFRPGPMENIPLYLKRRFSNEKITFEHKVLEDILKSTNGIIIYQEQIMKIANLFAGYSFGEADVLRRAVSKKQEDVLIKERSNFVEKAIRFGHTEKLSNDIYNYIVKFANYGFNRAHSVSYAMVSYWMAYLKSNYPKYFISVLLSSIIGSETQMKNYIFEAHKLGIKILKPSVNKSTKIFEPEGNDLRYPLLGIKNLGINTVNEILLEREKGNFKSYADFIARTHSFLSKRIIESLIYASALSDFKLSKRTMIEKLDEVINFTMYGNYISKDDFVLDNLTEYPYDVLEIKELSVLGFNLVMNPLNEFQGYIKKHKLLKPSTLSSDYVGKEIRIIGILSEMKKIKTKKDTDMVFITIQDEFSKISGVLFSNEFKEYFHLLEKNNVYLFMVNVEDRNNEIQLIVKKLHKL